MSGTVSKRNHVWSVPSRPLNLVARGRQLHVIDHLFCHPSPLFYIEVKQGVLGGGERTRYIDCASFNPSRLVFEGKLNSMSGIICRFKTFPSLYLTEQYRFLMKKMSLSGI